jgi:hypothetical protein
MRADIGGFEYDKLSGGFLFVQGERLELLAFDGS